MKIKSMCEIYENRGLFEPLFYAELITPEKYPVFDEFDMNLSRLENRWLIRGCDVIGNTIVVGFLGNPMLWPDEQMTKNLCHYINMKCVNQNIKTGIL